MRNVIAFPCLAGVLFFIPCVVQRAPSNTAGPVASVRGHYVEARTASVFAGACHYGSECTTRGREALLAWHFDAGARHGIDLTGMNAALAIAGEANLAEGTGARRSVLYLDAQATPAQQDAAMEVIRSRCGVLMGELVAVKRVPLSVAFESERYSARAGNMFELVGGKLANRECCKMPYDVWYAPFVDVAEALVGCDELFRFQDATLGSVWSRANQNEAFVGTFAWSQAPARP